jgi:hypothetical protein
VQVANTPRATVRVDPELADAARANIGLPDAPLSVLIRAGLALLAGAARNHANAAVAQAQPRGRGPSLKPRAGQNA